VRELEHKLSCRDVLDGLKQAVHAGELGCGPGQLPVSQNAGGSSAGNHTVNRVSLHDIDSVWVVKRQVSISILF
jgi:hypothetical protein